MLSSDPPIVVDFNVSVPYNMAFSYGDTTPPSSLEYYIVSGIAIIVGIFLICTTGITDWLLRE